MTGATAVASTPPVFVRVRTTATTCPVEAPAGADRDASSDAPVLTVAGPDTRGPVERATPETASVPVTVAVNQTLPAAPPVYVHVNVRDAPPASDTGSAGD